jgi:5-formyltetrahydrofolate cyclo-ligase
MDKSALRKRYRQERTLMNPQSIDLNNWRHILEIPEFKSANFVASYHSYGDEPATGGLNSEILESGKTLLLPKVRKDMDLDWIKWNGNPKELIKKGNFFEPSGEAIDSTSINFVIIPCLHVNRDGFRLGQGGGSYDRALSKMRAFRIGLIYSGEITNEDLYLEPHDQKLDAVATPELIVRF